MQISKKPTDARIAKMDMYEKLLLIIAITPEPLLTGTEQGRALLVEAIKLAPDKIRSDLQSAFERMYPDGGKGQFTAAQRAAIKGFRSIGGGHVNRWF